MSNKQKNNQQPEQELLDFLAAGKEARRVVSQDEQERENYGAATGKAHQEQEPAETAEAAAAEAVQEPAEEPVAEAPVEEAPVTAEPVEAEPVPAEEPEEAEPAAEMPAEPEEPAAAWELDLPEEAEEELYAEVPAEPEEPAAEWELDLPEEAEPELEPVLEEPGIEEPVIAEPIVEEPVIEEPAAEVVSQTVSEAEARKLGATVYAKAQEAYDPIGDVGEFFAARAASERTPEDPIGLGGAASAGQTAAAAAEAEAFREAVEAEKRRAEKEQTSKKKAKTKAPEKKAEKKKSQQSQPAKAKSQSPKAAAKTEKTQPKPEKAKPAKEPKPERKRSGKGGWIALGVIAALLCIALLGGAWYVSRIPTIYPGVKMQGMLLEHMTPQEAEVSLHTAGWDGPDGDILHVTLPGDHSFDVPASAMGWTATAEEGADVAYQYGRDGNFIHNGIMYVKSLFTGVDLTDRLASGLDEDALRKLVDKAVKESNDAVTDTMNVDTKAKVLTLVKGSELLAVDAGSVYDAVVSALKDHVSKLECSTELNQDANIDDLDLQVIHDDLCGEPVNASYDPVKKEVVEGEPGIEFDVEEAEKLWKAAKLGDTVKIPVTVTEPSFKAADVTELYGDLLASKSTSLAGSSASRINNITLAAQKINGVILMPGETFSYNKTVGQRTTAAGFQEAGAYANGEVVQEVGGGICQVSSTLYYCTLISNLKITSRTNHYFPVGYIESGMDATVSWGAPDFTFQNNRTFPIRIDAYVRGGSVYVEIHGTDVDGSTVRMDSTTSGLTTTTYRNVYDKDGELLSRTQEAVSVYHNHNENNNNNNNNNTRPNNNTNTNTNTNPNPPAPVQTSAPVQTPAPVINTPTPVETINTPTPVDDDAA